MTTLSYPRLIEQLIALCGARRSGTLFVTTLDNRAARFILHEGRIVSMVYGVHRGGAAIPWIRAIPGGGCVFEEGMGSLRTDHDLPDTPALLRELRGDADTAEAPAEAGATPDGRIDPAYAATVMELAQKELARHIGPVAGMVHDDYLEDYGVPATEGDLERFIDAMAVEAGDPANQRQFREALAARTRRSP